jgi:hypothetical protein
LVSTIIVIIHVGKSGAWIEAKLGRGARRANGFIFAAGEKSVDDETEKTERGLYSPQQAAKWSSSEVIRERADTGGWLRTRMSARHQ